MDRRDFIKRAATVIATGAIAIAGKEVAAKDVALNLSEGSHICSVGKFHSVKGSTIILVHEGDLQYTEIDITAKTTFVNHPKRQPERIAGLIQGELLFVCGEIQDNRFKAQVLGTPLETFKTTIQHRNETTLFTDIGELRLDEGTRSVKGIDMRDVSISDLKAGDLIQGSSIFDVGAQQRFVAMVGALN